MKNEPLHHREPDLEDLAAYIDGRLSEERRAQVEVRLAEDEDYYEIFLETLRFEEEEQEAAMPGKILRPSAWWSTPKVIAPLLAVAAALLFFFLPSGAEEDWASRLDPAKIAGLGERWYSPTWSTTRSGASETMGASRETSFRIGVRMVDLHLALAGEDRAAVKSVARHLAELTESAELYTASQSLADLPIDGPLQDLRTQGRRIEIDLTRDLTVIPEEARYFALGRWAEAGRLAAASGDGEALRSIARSAPDLHDLPPIDARLKSLSSAEPSAGAEIFAEIIDELAGNG